MFLVFTAGVVFFAVAIITLCIASLGQYNKCIGRTTVFVASIPKKAKHASQDEGTDTSSNWRTDERRAEG